MESTPKKEGIHMNKTEDNIIDLSNKDTVANLIMEAFDYIPGDEYLIGGDEE